MHSCHLDAKPWAWSEAVVSLQGKGARALRIQAFAGIGPSLDIPSTMWPGSRLRVVPKYCHLGGIIHHTGAVQSEVKARVGHAWTSFRQHQRRVFGSAFVTPHDKAVIFESIVLSTLVFAAGTWTVVRAEAFAPIQHALLQMSRIMLKPRYSCEQACHLPPAFVMSCAGVPSAMILLHSERLRHLALLVRLAPSELWAILHAEVHWLQLAQESVQWLLAQLARSGLKDCPNCWEECLGTVRTDMLDERWQAEVQLFHGHILRQLISLGAHPSLTVHAASSVVEVCAVCGQGFRDLRAWSHHAFKRHGRIRPERRLVDGCQCPVCLKTHRMVAFVITCGITVPAEMLCLLQMSWCSHSLGMGPSALTVALIVLFHPCRLPGRRGSGLLIPSRLSLRCLPRLSCVGLRTFCAITLILVLLIVRSSSFCVLLSVLNACNALDLLLLPQPGGLRLTSTLSRTRTGLCNGPAGTHVLPLFLLGRT